MNTTYYSEIEHITRSIFSTMLDIDVARVDAELDALPNDTLVTAIQITGEWVGSVVLSLSTALARTASSTMFTIPEQDVTNADEQEVAAELVNIIGGNLKSVLPGPSALSLPTVVAGSDFGVRIHSAEMIDDVWFDSDRGCLRVRLYAKHSER